MDMNANDGIAANREYKDRLFTFIFGKEENRPYLLQLYNALNGTSYTDPSELEITTLQDVIYIRQKNDISFLLDSELSLYEQQSSYNPNMPLRGLMYFSALYRQFLSRQGTDLYSSSLVKIHSPRYVVFYNGLRELPDVSKLRLSDAFEIPNESGEFEWTATVYNVNAGRNSAIMESCVALAQYADFIQWVRENSETMPAKDAVDAAVRQAIAQNYLNGFFKKHREEVVDVSLTEFNEEEFVRNRLKEGEAIGEARGVAKGVAKGVVQGEARLGKLVDLLLKQGLIDLAQLVAVDAQEREKQYQRFGIN